jgi:hypothetical protein
MTSVAARPAEERSELLTGQPQDKYPNWYDERRTDLRAEQRGAGRTQSHFTKAIDLSANGLCRSS